MGSGLRALAVRAEGVVLGVVVGLVLGLAIGSARFPARLAGGLAALGLAVSAGAEPRLDLRGTWHVIVHFRDASTLNPEAERWDDRVWVFEPTGSRLRWIEYPMVVFADKSGRFEALGANRASRVLGFWEPNAAQRAQIRAGPEVNPRGRTVKTLRGSDEAGWHSGARSRPGAASVLTYVETWSIEGSVDRPVFTQTDVLASGRSNTLEGVTRYTTTEVRGRGDELRGTFERDESRRGTFRMTRAGPVRSVQGSGRTQGERAMRGFQRGLDEDRSREPGDGQAREGEPGP